jgi:hypothetical protein
MLIGYLQLPWLTAWIQLKDFVRTVCEVDHVEIFPGSTSGWVRVKGHENFKAAFSRFENTFTSFLALLQVQQADMRVCDSRAAQWRQLPRTMPHCGRKE